MPVTLPGIDEIAAGKKIRPSILKGCFTALADHFGLITGADVDPNAGIPGTAIAARTLPADRIILNNVSQLEMGSASVGTAQLVDLNVTKGKLSTTVGQRVTKAQTELLAVEVAFSIASNPDVTYTGIWYAQGTANPGTNYPVSAYELVGIYVRDASISGAGNIMFSISVAPTTSTNWGCFLTGHGHRNGSGNMGGWVVYLFLPKT